MNISTMARAAGSSGTNGLRMTLTATLVAVLASFALSSWAQPMQDGPMGGGHGMGMMGGHGPGMGRHFEHMLDGLNATDAQRTQVKQIAAAAAADMKAQHDAGRALRDKAMQIFAAPNIDAAAAESVRQQMLAQHDQASRRMLQAMLDVGRVLTPEQRAKLGDRMKQRSDMMRDRMQRMESERPAK
jgi:periplasmic protein CpxP/Spy